MWRTALLAVAMVGTLNTTPATSADIAPVYKAPPPAAVIWNPWMIRVRALVVDPRNDVTFDQLPGGNATWSTAVVPELDITYFFTPNFAAELILGITAHRATGKDIVPPLASTCRASDRQDLSAAADADLPVSLHRFRRVQALCRRGRELHLLLQRIGTANTPGGNPAVRISSFKVNNAWAPAVQAGFDYMLDKHWGINVDVKYLWLQPTFSASVNDGAIPLTGKAKLDPWIYGGGITYKF